MAPGDRRRHRGACDQPALGRTGQLARDLARDAECDPPHGLLEWHPVIVERTGGHSHDAHQHRQHRRPRRGARSPVSGQSRPESSLRPADGLPGCGGGINAGGRAAGGARVPADRRTECALWRRCILSLSPPAALESGRARLDGVRTQARQACRPQLAAARTRPRERVRALLGRRRQPRGACRHPLRDHARHGHAAAARCRTAVRRHHGPPAEPASFRRRARAWSAAAMGSCSRG